MAADKTNRRHKRKAGESESEDDQQNKRTKTSDSLSSDETEFVAGKIQRILMRNFMCHDAMEINFNPKVNFIVGANGSGKSAILTALTVGLGAKARATNRGSSIKEFIKKGKLSASIEITIQNDGPMAYKYEEYGNSITVIRNIGKISSYKIKNWRGETISTRKEDLDNIVNFLNIQVDNPISVLNQDVSRSFLVMSEPKDKYQLFMKATRLDVIGKNYKDATIACEVNKSKLEGAKKFLDENEKEINHIKKKLKKIESLAEQKLEYSSLQNEVYWASVLEEEKKLLMINTKIKEQEETMDKFKYMELNKMSKEKEIDSTIAELQQEIAQIEGEAAKSSTKLVEMKQAFKNAKKIHDEKKIKAKELHNEIKRKETYIVTLQTEIQKREKENAAAGDRQQQIKQDLSDCEQQLDDIEATLRTKQTDNMHLEENKRRLEQEENKMKIELSEKRSAADKIQRRLNAFKSQPNDAFTVYGANMPRLLKRIEETYNRGKFQQKPVGPLGSFIKLKDSSWIPAIENHLGFDTLSAFCVDNSQDARILDLIIKEIYRGDHPPQILISKFFDQVHDVTHGCTKSSRYSNLLEAMEISHPVVANSLIDQREIECILLIPTSDEACSVMSNEQKVPRNCRRAITKNADLFYPDPNYRTYGGSVTRAKFLQVSTSEAIQLLQEELGVAQDEMEISLRECKEICERLKNNNVEMRQVQTHVRNLLFQQQRLKAKIEELKEAMEACTDNAINAYLNEIEELRRIVVEKKEQETGMLEDFRQSLKNLDSLTAELKNRRDLAQNLDSRISPHKERIKELTEEKSRLNVSNRGAARRMEETKQQLQKLNGELQQQQRVVNSKVDLATKACPNRIETTKTTGEISGRLKELKVTIETAEREYGTQDDLKKELEDKQSKYKGVQEFAISLHRSNEKQMARLVDRKHFYRKMKKNISQRVQESFSNILRLRNYKGSIIIDHGNQELNLEVTPLNDAKRPTNDAKALSGGERSYSTVSFILALWDSTGLPFYFLDEFDVFMDKINRRIIMDILLGHAQSHPHCQFAFLTPLDTSHIVADKSITIHRLDAPERS